MQLNLSDKKNCHKDNQAAFISYYQKVIASFALAPRYYYNFEVGQKICNLGV